MDEKKIEEAINNAWLNLGDTSGVEVVNPFLLEKTEEEIENPHIHLMSVMRNPDYFGFTCKYLLGKTLAPFQLAVLKELWFRPFPMLIAARGAGKSWLLAVYSILRAFFNQGCKVGIVGGAYRQAKVVFDYAEEIWQNAPVLQDICSDSRLNGPRRDIDRCTLRIGDSLIFAIPLGTGQKIRGQRANYIIGEEFRAIPVDIYENVVAGFASVSSNPIDKLQHFARIKTMKEMGVYDEDKSSNLMLSNQSIISGTASYGFENFYEYWQKWRAIIESRGDRGKLEEIFKGHVPNNFNWKDYSIIRLPVELIPAGYMDEKHVAKARATLSKSNYLLEFGACFAADSEGFFRRTLIESCVVGKKKIIHPSCGEVNFCALLRGHPERKYVMAIDPASEQDNFSITILEMWPEHRRIVYCWTTTRKRHKEKLLRGIVKEQNFYSYASRKIHELCRLFQIIHISLDSQGGIPILEGLHDPSLLEPGDTPIWPIIEEGKPKDTDRQAGRHILELVQFARAEWVLHANHGLKKDFEDKNLLFPEFDTSVIAIAIEEDKMLGRVKINDNDENVEKLYDTLEDCFLEIEEMKNELTTIMHTKTSVTGRDRWDTPEFKTPGGKKGHVRKDRYSSLLMANMAARNISLAIPQQKYYCPGGFAKDLVKAGNKAQVGVSPHWVNPSWYSEVHGVAVNKHGPRLV